MKTKGKKHRGRGCLTALIILALIAAAAAFLIKDSREDLEISRYEVASQKLPESFDGFKIVQLSDLHGAEFGEDGMELVDKVGSLEPDMIALTGDFVTDEGDLAAVESSLPDLLSCARCISSAEITSSARDLPSRSGTFWSAPA